MPCNGHLICNRTGFVCTQMVPIILWHSFSFYNPYPIMCTMSSKPPFATLHFMPTPTRQSGGCLLRTTWSKTRLHCPCLHGRILGTVRPSLQECLCHQPSIYTLKPANDYTFLHPFHPNPLTQQTFKMHGQASHRWRPANQPMQPRCRPYFLRHLKGKTL